MVIIKLNLKFLQFMLCKLFNKGTCRHDKQAGHIKKGITYQHYCSNCFSITGRKYNHSKVQCSSLKGEERETVSLKFVRFLVLLLVE